MRAQECVPTGQESAESVVDIQCNEPIRDTGNQLDNTVLLAAVVEKQLVPKLVLAGRSAHRIEEQFDAGMITVDSDQVEPFLELLLNGERGTCISYISALHEDGYSLESIYLDLLAPAARRLGPMWLDDEMSFSEISVALARLQTLVSKVARSETPIHAEIDPDRHIILARTSNEQHAFGLLMVAEFFRLAGWQVSGGADLVAGGGLNSRLQSEPYAVLGLTAGSKRSALELKKHIQSARRSSANPKLCVIVGGPAFVLEPPLSDAVGSDCYAVDGLEAVEQAEAFLSNGRVPSQKQAH